MSATGGSGDYAHREVTQQIIGAAYELYRELGSGFLERVYENALAFELAYRGLRPRCQVEMQVHYKGRAVGAYIADLLVNDCVLCEIKAAETIANAHQAQLLNYLKATGTNVGLLLNFGPKQVDVKRMVF